MNTKEYIISKLTELLIKNDYKEHTIKSTIWVKKSDVYKDLIKLVKEIK